MKILFTILIWVCLHSIALSQEYQATFGKYTGCLRAGGICTLQSQPESGSKTAAVNNISFVITKEGATLLRIYRDRLTAKEQDQVLGAPITTKNKNSLLFVM